MGKLFSKIYIEITNFCNLNCSFCSIDNRIKKEMSIDEFNIVIDKIKNYTNNIYLHVKGEPLLHSNLDKILKTCNDNNINVSITTNGTLLEKQLPILLNRKIKQINISLHSENKMKEYLDRVFNCCSKLSKNTTIIYRIWVLNNLNKISPIIVNKIKNYYQLSTVIVDKILNDKNIKIKNNIYVDKDYEFIWPTISNNKNNKGTCLGTRTHIAILSNGDVIPCCLDSNANIKLGNIFQDSLEDIINNRLFQNIKIGFQNNQIICDLCKSCTYRERFKKV